MNKKIIFLIGALVFSLFILWVFSSFDMFWFLRYGGKIVGKEQAFCYDTDNGLSFYDKGVVYGKSSVNIDFRYFDVCVDDNKLQEWLCVNLEPTFNFFDCPRGCFNGLCKI